MMPPNIISVVACFATFNAALILVDVLWYRVDFILGI